MNNLSARQRRSSGESIMGWLIGVACAVSLTVSLAVGIGRVLTHQTDNRDGAAVVQPATALKDEGLLPPLSDEYQHYHQSLAALRESVGLVPPPLDEYQSYRKRSVTGDNAVGMPPEPVFGSTKY